MMQAVDERRQALERSLGSWQPRNLARWLDDVAGRHPARPFVITDGRSYTYADVQAASRRIARGLMARGIGAGEHVALIVANYPEFVTLTFGIARAGAVSVPLNFRLRAEEIRYVLFQSDSAAVITMAGFGGFDYLAALDSMAADLPRLRLRCALPGDASVPTGELDLQSLELAAESVSEPALEERTDQAAPGSTAAIFYTSGTTGFPKGVMLSHDQLLRSAYGSAYTRAFEDGRRILFALPLYHVFAYIEGMLATTFAGGAIIPELAFDPAATYRAIERHHPGEALFVPTMSVAVTEHPGRGDFDVSSLHAVMSAAAPAPVWLWNRIVADLGVEELFTGYGMTETSAATTLTMPGDPVETVSSTVGRVKPGGLAGPLCEYRTIDPFTQVALADGAEGELVVRGAIVTSGYYNKAEETAATIDAEGWLRSGDLGRIDERGYLQITGRSKELYKCGGELVAPKEVEELLTRHPDVGQAYVVGVPDERMGEVGVAFIVAGAAQPSAEELLEYCRAHLARFKVPHEVRFVAAADLPVTATGKVQKFRLAELAAAVRS